MRGVKGRKERKKWGPLGMLQREGEGMTSQRVTSRERGEKNDITGSDVTERGNDITEKEGRK